MRLLFLNGDLPVFPGWGGVEYLHTTRLARIAEGVGLVSLVHTREQLQKTEGLAAAGLDLYLWKSPALAADGPAPAAARRWLRRMAEAVYTRARTSRGRPRDTLVQDLQFRNLSALVAEALSSRRWQGMVVVQSTCARWLDYVPSPPVSVLVLHDARALVYERQAMAAVSRRQRRACLREARRYRRFEREYCQRYDLVVTVSPADEAWVREHYQPRRLMTIPLPVDGHYFRPMSGIGERAARIVFTGMMAHPPNVDAACFFAREVLPLVHAERPEAEFWIVGRDPAPAVRALAGRPGVVVTGFVSDMRPYLAQATVVVVPLRFGSGMRQKILEAWAMRKCVISTTVGAEGLDARDGENILLADGAQAMADRVVEAIRDVGLRDRTRAQGRSLVWTAHHPGLLARRYHDEITSVLRDKRHREEPIRAAIDLRWMYPGRAGGIENLSRSFLDELLAIDRSNRYTILLPAQARYDFDLRGRANFRLLASDGPRHYARRAIGYAARRLHRKLGINYWRTPEVEALGRARALDAEVALSIPGYIHPDLSSLANVLIAPDIQHEYRPEFFAPAVLEERRRIYTDSARRAVHICAISEFTRQTLIERLGLRPEAITTTHLAADPIFHPGSPARAGARRVLERHGLRAGTYVLFPGNTWPHKNHRGALAALRILREAHGLDPLLVCTGSSREAHGDLLRLVGELGLEDRVKLLGYCPATDMPGLYEGAAALFFPSLFEGFGLPLLEAMWCDCPIVASRATSLPEIAGDAAVLVDPRAPEEMAQALGRVLTDSGLRRELVERGRRRARDFSWEAFTLQVVRVLAAARLARYAG
ncbi:MAG TPA: glycosyltransferase [Candidatus Methylomirabilis sp.]|nr:glycosyltransferase [Candidatus Methylomirabilis sp.]